MTLLHVVASMNPQQGGVCQAVRTMVAGLAGQAVHNEVASLDAPDAAWNQHDAFPAHALGPARGPWGHSAKLVPWLLANFSRFDVVILHGLWLYQGYAVRKALRQFRAQNPGLAVPRLYVMPHGMLDPYFQRASGRKLKAWRNWAYWKLIEQHVVNEADGLLFTCETERQLAHQPFAPYRPRQEAVVGLGVEEPPAFEPAMEAAFRARCPQAAGQPYLLFLGRIDEKKGVDLLLNAYAQTAGRPVPIPVGDPMADDATLPALVVAGPGLASPYGQRMQALAAPHPAVLFPGMLTGDAKWGAFYGCEAFVLPSHQENFGIAVVEALACGKPVLVSNQVNIWQEIVAGGGGFAADDTPAGTAAVLTHWLGLNCAAKQQAGHQARRLYAKHFAVASAARNLLQAVN